jgi:hypothetical protein
MVRPAEPGAAAVDDAAPEIGAGVSQGVVATVEAGVAVLDQILSVGARTEGASQVDHLGVGVGVEDTELGKCGLWSRGRDSAVGEGLHVRYGECGGEGVHHPLHAAEAVNLAHAGNYQPKGEDEQVLGQANCLKPVFDHGQAMPPDANTPTTAASLDESNARADNSQLDFEIAEELVTPVDDEELEEIAEELAHDDAEY